MKIRFKSAALITALAYTAFISIGLPDGLLGVAWPSIRSHFGLRFDSIGSLLVIFTAGYLTSSFSSGALLARVKLGVLLSLSCLATAASLIGYSVATSWMFMVCVASIAGLGAGAIDAGLNTFAAKNFSARVLNWLHAFYGIGAAAGPLIMTSMLESGHRWQAGYAIVGTGQLALAICFALTANHWRSSAIRTNTANVRRRASNLETLKLPVAWLGAAVFFVYTGIEAAAGTWAFSLFTVSRGISMATGGMWVSVYWFCLTAGRLLSGFIAGSVSQYVLLRFCVVGIAGGAAMIWLGGATAVSFFGLALMGLASAPVFPGLISSSPQRLGDSHAANGIGFQIAAAVLGQSLLPALVGVFVNRFGLETVGVTLLVSSVILIVMYLSLAASVARPRILKEGVALVRGT